MFAYSIFIGLIIPIVYTIFEFIIKYIFFDGSTNTESTNTESTNTESTNTEKIKAIIKPTQSEPIKTEPVKTEPKSKTYSVYICGFDKNILDDCDFKNNKYNLAIKIEDNKYNLNLNDIFKTLFVVDYVLLISNIDKHIAKKIVASIKKQGIISTYIKDD